MPNHDMMMDRGLETRIKKRHNILLQKLVKTTHFSYEELETLLVIYYKLTRDGPMDRKRFREILHSGLDLTGESLSERIFYMFDRNNIQIVNLESWITGLSIFLRGTLEEKTIYCFTVYDIPGTGLITRDTMFLLMKNTLVSQPSGEDTEEAVRDMCDVILKKIDVDRDGKVSLADFRETVKRNRNMLEALGPCLPSRRAVDAFFLTFTNIVGLF